VKQIFTLVLLPPSLTYWIHVLFHESKHQVMLLHQICWLQHNSLSRSRFFTSSSKFNLWICIFNLMLLSVGILLQIVGRPLCFTSLHFTRNYWCCLRRYVAHMFFFCARISLFWLKNSSRCYKLLIYLIYT
jgi:hypothetical protein